MSATALLRVAAMYRLRDLMREEAGTLVPAGTEIRRGFPRDPQQRGTLVVVGEVDTSEVSVPAQQRGTKQNNDTFTFVCWSIAWDVGTAEFDEVDAASEAGAELVRRTLARHPQLDLDGNGLAGVAAATMTTCDGPNPWHTSDGVGSGCRILVTVTTRIGVP